MQEPTEKPQRSRARWGAFAPIPRLIKDDHRFVAGQMREALRAKRPSCPICQSGRLHPTGHAEVRQCDECRELVTLDELAITYGHWLQDTAQERFERYRRDARWLLQLWALVLVLVAILSAWLGWWSPLAAAAIVSVPVLSYAFALRYRAWQAATGRVFETRAPLSDFVKTELYELVR